MINAQEKAQQIKKALPMLTVEIVGKWVWVSGNTRAHTAALKAFQCFWSGSKHKWFWNGATHKRSGAGWDYNRIVYTYGSQLQEVA